MRFLRFCPILIERSAHVDRFLNWKEHVTLTSNRIRRCIYKFRQIRSFLEFKIIRQLYFALVHSIILYGIAVWGGACSTTLQPIVRSTQVTLRVALNKHRRYPSALLYEELDVPNFKQSHMAVLLSLMSDNSSTNLNLPSIINHQHNTRQKTNQLLESNQVNRSIYFCSPIYKASKYFNTLPLEIRALKNENCYKQKIKDWVKSIT